MISRASRSTLANYRLGDAAEPEGLRASTSLLRHQLEDGGHAGDDGAGEREDDVGDGDGDGAEVAGGALGRL